MSWKWMIGAALVAVLGLPAAVRGHAGHVHKVMGTVSARQDNTVEIKTTEGKIVTVTLTEKTTFARGKQKVTSGALQVGDRVVVDVGDGKQMIARSVALGTAPVGSK